MSAKSIRIDALRGFAILSVFQYHYGSCLGVYAALGAPEAVQVALDRGWAGVDIFFVLSAFLLTRNLVGRGGDAGAAVAFYRRRILRILPLYLLLLAAAAALIPILGASEGQPGAWLFGGLAPAWIYSLFLQNFWSGLQGDWSGHFLAPTWSLAVEEHFYLILPFLVLRLSPRQLATLALSCLVTAPILRMAIDESVGPIAMTTWSIGRVDCFGWGMLVALALVHGKTGYLRLGIGAASLLVCGLLLGGGDADSMIGSLTAVIGVLLTLIAAEPRDGGAARPGFLVKGAAWMGERCYSIYLLHMPVVGLVTLAFGYATPAPTEPRGLIAIVISVAITLILSNLSYRFIERPFIALGARQDANAPGIAPV